MKMDKRSIVEFSIVFSCFGGITLGSILQFLVIMAIGEKQKYPFLVPFSIITALVAGSLFVISLTKYIKILDNVESQKKEIVITIICSCVGTILIALLWEITSEQIAFFKEKFRIFY